MLKEFGVFLSTEHLSTSNSENIAFLHPPPLPLKIKCFPPPLTKVLVAPLDLLPTGYVPYGSYVLNYYNSDNNIAGRDSYWL